MIKNFVKKQKIILVMATKTQCRRCKKRKNCPILEAIEQEEIFRQRCTEDENGSRSNSKKFTKGN